MKNKQLKIYKIEHRKPILNKPKLLEAFQYKEKLRPLIDKLLMSHSILLTNDIEEDTWLIRDADTGKIRRIQDKYFNRKYAKVGWHFYEDYLSQKKELIDRETSSILSEASLKKEKQHMWEVSSTKIDSIESRSSSWDKN